MLTPGMSIQVGSKHAAGMNYGLIVGHIGTITHVGVHPKRSWERDICIYVTFSDPELPGGYRDDATKIDSWVIHIEDALPLNVNSLPTMDEFY